VFPWERPVGEPDENPRVRLVSATPRAEETILYCARVSSDQTNTDTGLLGYLVRNGHWSPFEMAHMVLEVRTSRAIAAQILRHRSFSFQEFSQRYAVAPGTVKYSARRQAERNRQSSVDDLTPDVKGIFDVLQTDVEDHCRRAYETALELGVSREQARFLLPLATETVLYMAGSLRSWIHYLAMRTDSHTQQEHRELALEAAGIFAEQFPTIWAAVRPAFDDMRSY
jgi:thymidylate synthase (FAD)